ncbi:MAG: hypothetical protein ABFD44_07090 [Anaerolineaceae bacterium]
MTALGVIAVILISLSALVLLNSRDWRWVTGALAVMYLGVFLLVGQSWNFSLAVLKVVIGWMAAVVLGITQMGQTHEQKTEENLPSGRIFRTIASGLVFLVVFSIAPGFVSWLPELSSEQAVGGMILIGMGLLQLGMTARPIRVVVGLLTTLAGFEIIYAAVEASVLVAGLLGGVNLGLALVGAYLMTAPEMEDAQ